MSPAHEIYVAFLCTLDVANICFRGHNLSDSVHDRIVAKFSLASSPARAKNGRVPGYLQSYDIIDYLQGATFKSTSGIR